MSWLEDISKLIPVEHLYKDAAQPAVKQVGQALEKTAKAARFIVGPLEYLAAQHDRWERYLQRIADKVPNERLISAHPQIAGPALDGLRYVQEDNVIAELFLNLLARAIDKDRVHEAHPAFAHIIAQLSPDEAVILYSLKSRSYAYHQYSKYDSNTNSFSVRSVTYNEFPINKLIFSQNFGLYMDHLHSLNLGGIWQNGNQEAVFERDQRVQTGVNIRNIIQVTAFGKMFVSACIPDYLQDIETAMKSSDKTIKK